MHVGVETTRRRTSKDTLHFTLKVMAFNAWRGINNSKQALANIIEKKDLTYNMCLLIPCAKTFEIIVKSFHNFSKQKQIKIIELQ